MPGTVSKERGQLAVSGSVYTDPDFLTWGSKGNLKELDEY